MLRSNWLGDGSRAFCSAKRTDKCKCVAHQRKALDDASHVKVKPSIPGARVVIVRKGVATIH